MELNVVYCVPVLVKNKARSSKRARIRVSIEVD